MRCWGKLYWPSEQLLPKNPPAHIAYATHFASHGDTIGKGLQGPLELARGDLQLRLLDFPHYPYCSFKLIEVILELELLEQTKTWARTIRTREKRAEDTAKRSGCNYCRLSPDFPDLRSYAWRASIRDGFSHSSLWWPWPRSCQVRNPDFPPSEAH